MSTFKGVCLAALAGCCWSTLSLVGKVLNDHSANVISVAVVRLLVLVLGWGVGVTIKDRRLLYFPGNKILFLWLSGTVTVFCIYLGYIYSLRYISVPTAVILLYTYPLWTTLASGVFLGERPSWVQMASSALIVSGAAIAVGVSAITSGPVSLLGVCLVLSCAFGMALFSLFGRLSSRGGGMAQETFFLYFHLMALLSMSVLGALTGALGDILRFTPTQWWGTLVIGFIGSLGGYGVFFLALRDISASLGSGVATTELVVTLVLSAILLGQSPTLWEILGSLVIVIGIGLGVFGEKLKGTS